MKKILFICTGNTCRSPMAAALFNRMLKEAGIRDVQAESAGLAAAAGELASENARLAAAEAGADLGGHRSRNVDARMIGEFGEIYTMTPAHREALLRAFPGARGKVSVLGGGIPDPFGGSLEIYRRCRDAILAALKPIEERLISGHE